MADMYFYNQMAANNIQRLCLDKIFKIELVSYMFSVKPFTTVNTKNHLFLFSFGNIYMMKVCK